MNEEETKELLKKLRFSSDEYYIVDGAYAKNIDYLLIENAIKTVLNLLEKKDTEISKLKKENDEMAETLRYYNGMQQEQCFCIDICGEKECDMKNCKNRIKQYFEDKVTDTNVGERKIPEEN